jgi:hypothetical protein
MKKPPRKPTGPRKIDLKELTETVLQLVDELGLDSVQLMKEVLDEERKRKNDNH